ncbi:radical SAM protein [Methanophagales archaeon]|nr:MAG: radical SAM protein [Methanophagales archaeon]
MGNKALLNEAEIIAYLNRVMDSTFARFIMKKLSQPKSISKSLAIYAGVEEAEGVKEKVHAKVVATAIEKGAAALGVEPPAIKNFLKDPYIRKGFSVIIRGIAEYGITKPQRLSAPFLVVWNFTKECNLRCKHCYACATPHPAPDELTLEEKMEVVDQLDEAGVAAISFSGGEPLMNKHLLPVAEHASSRGFYLSVATNGTLITPKMAKRMKNAGIRYAEVSIDGPTAEIHDAFRGVKGAFDRTIAGLKNAKDAGLTVGIATTATHHNIDVMAEMLELGRMLQVDRIIVFSFVPTGRGREIVKEDLGPEEREDLMNYLYREWQKGDMQIVTTSPCYARISLSNALRNAGAKISPTHFAELDLPAEYLEGAKALTEFIGGCGAGRIYCSVEHNGDIQPCVFMPIKLGNVLKDGFQNVWDNSEVLLELRDRNKSDYACSSCPYRYICGGCRARAYAYYGDIKAPDPGCIMQKAEWDKIINRERRIYNEEKVR